MVVQLVVLYAPRAAGTGGVPYADKLVHAAVFGAVAVTGRWVGARAVVLGALLAAHAVVSELVQHWLLPHRSGDVRDVLADLTGTVVGLLVVLPRRAPTGRAGARGG